VKRKRLIIIIFGFLAAVILGALLWPREREPEYKGIALSKWLENYKWHDAEFARAIKHMGTNALPFLIRAAKYEDPRWRTWLGHTISKWPVGALDSRFGKWLLGDKPISRAGASVIAFGILGPDADPALDELRQIQRDSKDPSTSDRAGQCIQFITERIGSGAYRQRTR
jgi:hypothetical protein